MFTSILVPLDGSSFAEQALPLAASIAERVGAAVRLALVHRSPPSPATPDATAIFTGIEVALRRSERGYLERLSRGLAQEHGCVASPVLLVGAPARALERYVEEAGISLVVMSTHGRGGLERVWLGSIADYLVRSSSIPVLLVRPSETAPEPQLVRPGCRILVPLDGSPQAESVLDPAAQLARAFDAELSLVQVVPPVAIAADLPLPAAVGYDEHLTEVRRAEADDYLADVADTLRESGTKTSYAAVLGSFVTETLLDLAGAHDVGLIAVATHGRGGLPRLVLGSVADKLVRAATRPVLVYRPPALPNGWQARRQQRESATPHG